MFQLHGIDAADQPLLEQETIYYDDFNYDIKLL